MFLRLFPLLVPALSAVVLGCSAGCDRRASSGRPASVAVAVTQTSVSCGECHGDVFRAWSGTDHALANRAVHRETDAEALAGLARVDPGVVVEYVLGNKPAWQPLVRAAGGRWQPHEQAYDPGRKEWFNVFGNEVRQPGEWGHWTGRGMNWNSMCAHCHMTGYQRGYDSTTDSYHSTWVEQGVGCIQCHGPTSAGHGQNTASRTTSPQNPPLAGDRQRLMQTCAPCHARNELLTETFQPGDSYHDHYRVTLPVDAATFYADGQQRDEVFNWTSMLLSRMGHAGVTCLDCHDPHTTKTILPVSNNQLCLQCHGDSGRIMAGGIRAVPIDPLAHSRHQADSAGNSCVACHMPSTTYMQRSPRHDHGWLKPDPLLTKELGIPNACSTCHSDQTVDWAIAKSDAWYGTKLDSRQRARARAIAAAQSDQSHATEGLLALLRDEDIPAWRATYLSLLATLGDGARGQAVAQTALNAKDPLERAAAVRYFTGAPDASRLLTPLLQDPVRLVRLDAAWALSAELPPKSASRDELDAYLTLMMDQPAGRVRLGQDLANRGDLVSAANETARAVTWDPYSPGIRDAHAMVLAGLGKSAEAGSAFYRAAELAGAAGAPMAMRAGLAFAEAGQLTEAENSFRLAVRSDPKFHRAWYNLGLLLAQVERLPEAMTALREAEAHGPTVADYPYALATVLIRSGDNAGAREAAQRALRIEPGHPGARQIQRAP